MTEMTPGTAVEQEARKLAGLEGQIDDSLKGADLRQATIVSYDSAAKTATIRLGGDTTDIAGVHHLGSYAPTAGDTGVWVLKKATTLLLLGASGTPSGPSPTGAIVAFGGSSAPVGWLLCNGSTVSRTTYAALFAVLGTAYGAGDGSTTFGLPNLTQRFPLGKSSSGVGATLGSTGGALTDAFSDTASHSHALNSSDSHAQLTWVSGTPEVRMNRKSTNGWSGNIDVETVAAGGGSTTNTTGLTLGGSSADGSVSVSGTVDIVPPFQTVNYIVRT